LRGAAFAPVAVSLLREVTANAIPADATACAALIKGVPVTLDAVQPIDRAISTAGGVPFAELDDRFMLRTRAGVFVAGEMLDWDAPTGGYLLQACFSTAVAAARGVLGWLAEGNTLRRGLHADGGLPAP
jgi:predicted flavoprotein YhiN